MGAYTIREIWGKGIRAEEKVMNIVVVRCQERPVSRKQSAIEIPPFLFARSRLWDACYQLATLLATPVYAPNVRTYPRGYLEARGVLSKHHTVDPYA